MTISPAQRRRKGHDFERFCAEQMRAIGWEDCRTTRDARGGNWCQSDNGIDLVETEPFQIQCKRKATYSHISAIEEIQAEEGTIPLLLSKADGKPTMAVLPWEELQMLIRFVYKKPA